jgi:hypothetical protein
MAPIMASSEALSMPHLAMHNASSQAAAMAIKTDQNNHFLMYYSYINFLCKGTAISRTDLSLSQSFTCQFPTLPTSSGLHN